MTGQCTRGQDSNRHVGNIMAFKHKFACARQLPCGCVMYTCKCTNVHARTCLCGALGHGVTQPGCEIEEKSRDSWAGLVHLKPIGNTCSVHYIPIKRRYFTEQNQIMGNSCPRNKRLALLIWLRQGYAISLVVLPTG